MGSIDRAMVKKRRHSGRNKPAGARGHVRRVRCETSGCLVPKDKAVKRYIVRNIVDASALPKLYRKVYYSISAAIHSRVVRVRSRVARRNTPLHQGLGLSPTRLPDRMGFLGR